jgi:tRNA threonylcarbamoyladenosine biosynthesis protein TsaE
MALNVGPITLASEEQTAMLARRIAAVLGPGDTLLLAGEIGAGKSAFARALIQARLGRAEDVPSPTFTLVQTYEHPDADIWHCDLYRLSQPDEVLELGLDTAFETAICLVEWPDRLGPLAPPTALCLNFAAFDGHHEVTISGPDTWAQRMEAVLVGA